MQQTWVHRAEQVEAFSISRAIHQAEPPGKQVAASSQEKGRAGSKWPSRELAPHAIIATDVQHAESRAIKASLACVKEHWGLALGRSRPQPANLQVAFPCTDWAHGRARPLMDAQLPAVPDGVVALIR